MFVYLSKLIYLTSLFVWKYDDFGLSTEYKQIQEFIVHELKQGVTLYEAIGGYYNDKKIELITILDKNSYAKLLQFVHSVDEDAFMTVSTTNEIIGSWNIKRKLGGN